MTKENNMSHSPAKPPGQGSFGPVHTSQPKTSTNTNSQPGKSVIARGVKVPGVGGSKKS